MIRLDEIKQRLAAYSAEHKTAVLKIEANTVVLEWADNDNTR